MLLRPNLCGDVGVPAAVADVGVGAVPGVWLDLKRAEQPSSEVDFASGMLQFN